jgi:hypothetical protein
MLVISFVTPWCGSGRPGDASAAQSMIAATRRLAEERNAADLARKREAAAEARKQERAERVVARKTAQAYPGSDVGQSEGSKK